MKKIPFLLFSALFFLSFITSSAQSTEAIATGWQGSHEEINSITESIQFSKVYKQLSTKKGMDMIASNNPEFTVTQSEVDPKCHFLKSSNKIDDITIGIMDSREKAIIVTRADTTVVIERGVITLCSTAGFTFAVGSDRSVRLLGSLDDLSKARALCKEIFEKIVQ